MRSVLREPQTGHIATGVAACVLACILFSQPFAYAQTATESVEPDAAYEALLQLETYLEARSKGLRDGWIFGPNLDDCYFYRTRYNDTSELLDSSGTSAQKRFAVSHGIPSLNAIPEGERNALFVVNYEGRRSGIDDSRQILCVKHIPGGTRLLENTEHIRGPVVYREGLEEWRSRLDPFEAIMHAARPLPALMTSHACYPGLETSMRKLYPDIGTWIPSDMSCPATFSPWIMQGLVERYLGYSGPLVTDWVDMGAVNRFLLDNKRRFPSRYGKLSDEGLIVVLALEAGCNFVTGIQNRLLRISRPVDVAPLIRELVEYRRIDSSWQLTVDTRMLEALTWFGNPPFTPDTANVQAAMRMLFADKLRLVIGETVEYTDALWTNKLVTKGFQDLWNRQGLLHAQLRSFYLKARYGITMPELPYRSDDERVVTIDKNIDWIDGLMNDGGYKDRYSSILWNSIETSKAWETALQRLKRERGYEDN